MVAYCYTFLTSPFSCNLPKTYSVVPSIPGASHWSGANTEHKALPAITRHTSSVTLFLGHMKTLQLICTNFCKYMFIHFICFWCAFLVFTWFNSLCNFFIVLSCTKAQKQSPHTNLFILSEKKKTWFCIVCESSWSYSKVLYIYIYI